MNFSTASVTLSSKRPPQSLASLELMWRAETEKARRGRRDVGRGKGAAEEEEKGLERNERDSAVRVSDSIIMVRAMCHLNSYNSSHLLNFQGKRFFKKDYKTYFLFINE